MFELSRTGTWSMLCLRQMSKHHKNKLPQTWTLQSLNRPNGVPMVIKVTCGEVSFGIVMLKPSNGQTAAMQFETRSLDCWPKGPCMRTAWLNQHFPGSPVFWERQTATGCFLLVMSDKLTSPWGSSKRSIWSKPFRRLKIHSELTGEKRNSWHG